MSYARLHVTLYLKVKFKDKLIPIEKEYIATVIGKDLEDLLDINGRTKNNVTEDIKRKFKLKMFERVVINSMEVLHHQGFTTYKI